MPALPEPPEETSEIALRAWNRLAPMLHARGLMAEDYRDALALYCEQFAVWTLAKRALGADGAVLESEKLICIIHKATEMMRKLLQEFGMTPASVSRVTPASKDATGNRFGALGS
jgi:P27 family predicted phage terminase small subunit